MVRSELAQETPASGLLDLHSALEEMERLNTVAEQATVPRQTPHCGSGSRTGSRFWWRNWSHWRRTHSRSRCCPPRAAPPSRFSIPRCPPKWAEAIRKLRGRVLEERARWEAAGRRLGSVAIVSPRRASGRSTTARNLAACLGALPETKVLLVDADAVVPSLHRRLRVAQAPGTHRGDLGRRRRLASTRTAGAGFRSSRADVRSGRRGDRPSSCTGVCRRFSTAHAAEFAWVILDVPAMESADGEALSGVTDGTVLVLRNQREYFDEADAAVRRLDPARLLGAILNYA